MSDNLVEDWEQKVEEIIALESIYGSDFSLLGLDGPDGEISVSDALELSALECNPASWIECQITITVDTPDDAITLLLKDGLGSTSQAEVVGGKVQNLPPVSLTLTLPPGYPSSEKPEFSLDSFWLSPAHQEATAKCLNELWESVGFGVPACFTWIDWLKSSLLNDLGMSESIVIYDEEPMEDVAGPSTQTKNTYQPADRTVMNMLRYDATKEVEIFMEGTWECPICMVSKPGREFVRVPTCKHIFCKGCFHEFCRVNVKEGQVELKCPAFKCGKPLEQHIIREVLTQEEYARWEDLLLKRTLDKMKDVRYCPRCNFVCVEEPGSFAQCQRCFFAFCTKCFEAWHPGEKCFMEELLGGPSNLNKDGSVENELEPKLDNSDSREEMARKVKLKRQEAKSKAAVLQGTKACPGCAMRIAWDGGCNKMRCTYCNTTFCYRCGETITGYDHFWNNNCVLFEQEEVVRWEAQQANLRQREERFQLHGHALVVQERRQEVDALAEQLGGNARRERLSSCPFCRQDNFKTGNNNHIRCWSCSLGHCFLCKAKLGKTMKSHFSRGKCKQHS